jgi:hypothetical protein
MAFLGVATPQNDDDVIGKDDDDYENDDYDYNVRCPSTNGWMASE